MKQVLKVVISVVMSVAFVAVCVYASAFYDADDLNDKDLYAEWMNCISDDTPLTEIALPGTHNSGAVDCKLLGNEDMPADWLSCQGGGIYEQLVYGARYLDLRVIYDSIRETVFCTHGLGYGITLESALADVARFDSDYPGQFYFLSITLYNSDYSAPSAESVKRLISGFIPTERVFPSGTDVAAMTLGEMRASGKTFVLLTYEDWADEVSGFSRLGTWNSDTNFGTTESGGVLYGYLDKALGYGGGENTVFLTELNRVSGSSLDKELPLDFMLSDRELFLEFMDGISDDKTKLHNANFFVLDFATYDYVQCARVIELNLEKGIVASEYAEKLQDEINSRLSRG